MVQILETPRLRLREWRASDDDPWAALCADARVMATLGAVLEREVALADATRLAARLTEHGYGWWVLERKADGVFLGIIALQDVPYVAHLRGSLEIGWRLAYDAWGFGYATEGARAALAFAFDSLARAEVIAMTAAINRRSQRVMQRLGMTTTSDDDFDHVRVIEGSPLRPHVLYRITRAAFAIASTDARDSREDVAP